MGRCLFVNSVCKQDALQLFSPVSVFLGHSVMEFLSLQEGLLCCSVESLHFTICLGMIGTGDVTSNVGQLIEILTDLKNKLRFLGILEIKFIKKILGCTLDNFYKKKILVIHCMRYMY